MDDFVGSPGATCCGAASGNSGDRMQEPKTYLRLWRAPLPRLRAEDHDFDCRCVSVLQVCHSKAGNRKRRIDTEDDHLPKKTGHDYQGRGVDIITHYKF
jgi:hypothetical protein